MKTLITLSFLAVLTAQPLVNDDVLEPSVANEVDHALARVPTNRVSKISSRAQAAVWHPPVWTNGLSRTQIAIRLVSTQRSDGRWLVGTNDVTAVAIQLLNGCREAD